MKNNNLKSTVNLISPLLAVLGSLSFFILQFLFVPESFLPKYSEFSWIVWTYVGYYLPLICGGYIFRWVYWKLINKMRAYQIVLGGLVTYTMFEFGNITPFGYKREILLGILPGCLYILFLSGLLKLTVAKKREEQITLSDKDISSIVWLRLIPLLSGIGVFFISHLRFLIYHLIYQPEPSLVGWDFSPFAAWANFLLTVGPMIVMGYLVVAGYKLSVKWGKKLFAVLLLVLLGVFVFWSSMWLSDYILRDILFALMNVLIYMIPLMVVLWKNSRYTIK